MPEQPPSKLHPHPFRGDSLPPPNGSAFEGGAGWGRRVSGSPAPYAELAVTSNFTFLTGASHPEEFMHQAAALGHRAIAITDTNTLAGIVRAHCAAKEAGVSLIVGCRLKLARSADDPVARVADSPWRASRLRESSEAVHQSAAKSDALAHSALTPNPSPKGRGEQEAFTPHPSPTPPLGRAGPEILVYPTNRPAYARLCQLLTLGKRRAPKGECHLTLNDLPHYSEGMLAVVMPPDTLDDAFADSLRALRSVFNEDRLSLAACRRYEANDASRIRQLAKLARESRVPLVAINDVHYHVAERRPLQDVLTCIRHGCTIEQAGLRLAANAERHLKPPEEMARLFAAYSEAMARTIEIADCATAFSLDELRYEYPVEPCPLDCTPMRYLTQLTFAGAANRYVQGVPDKVRNQLEYELRLIDELHYEAYFLTCYDIVKFARSRGILCQGRGGAANSAVCYCLGITQVDPARFSLLFERFVSRARDEPPDIDIDFEHERREEVIQYIYGKYGRDRAALTAEVISYRGRSAIREVGKAMGLSLDGVDALAKNLGHWCEDVNEQRVREAGFDADDPTIRQVLKLTQQIVSFPRHLSQHVGGFVITRTPLCELVPIENAAMDDRTVIEWDKDDIDAMGMLKVDCLGLGMLTCIRKSFELVENGTNEQVSIPRICNECGEDPAVYHMIQRADTIGVFQIESRAQMSMLPRLKPREFYDLVIEVAIVRPGPIQGKMVHPYLRRRNGEEPVTFPNKAIEDVLGRTLGVPLFQEQAMQLAIVAAGFSPDEADQLRRAMAAWKRKGDAIFRFGQRLIDGMIERGYPAEFAERCFEQIKGFSEYGFPESHAASFALLVYVSCWLKRYRPAAFAAALINSQPMGFYRPAQIVRDAQEHGVAIHSVDVNHSEWDCTLETDEMQRDHDDADERRSDDDPRTWGRGGPAIRLGMRLVKGLSQKDADAIAKVCRERGSFPNVASLWRASGVSVNGLRCLARADAFGSMQLDRQMALWQIRPLRDERLPLFESNEAEDDVLVALPQASAGRRVLQDYQATGLSLKAHPVSFMRSKLGARGVTANEALRDAKVCPQDAIITVSGIVLVRQRPSTASGVVFITLEDETGIANLVIWRNTFEKHRKVARLSTMLLARGRVERQGEVVHVHAQHMESLDESLPQLTFNSRDFH